MTNMTNSNYEAILEDLEALPVIDAHEHSRDYSDCVPRNDPNTFLSGGYIQHILNFVDPRFAQDIRDPAVPDRDRWVNFLKSWPYLRATGFGTQAAEILRGWGIDDNLTTDSYDQILAKLQDRSPEMARSIVETSGTRAVITHYLGHPCCGGVDNIMEYLEDRLTFASNHYPLLGTLPLHQFYHFAEVERLGRMAGNEVYTLDDLVHAVETIVDRAVRKGAIGLKDHAAYTRGLAFGEPDRVAALREFHLLKQGDELSDRFRGLSDYLFDKILRTASDHNLPMALHTGMLVAGPDPKSNVQHFANLIERFPRMRFDLFHLNYPWLDDLLSVLKRFPNTVANCCWTQALDPVYAEQAMSQMLGSCTANRVIAFGADSFGDSPEIFLAHLKITKRNMAGALAHAVARGRISRMTAGDIARLWLYENPRQFYRLKTPQD